MGLLAIDGCAALHAKQTGSLTVLEALIAQRQKTKAVRNDCDRRHMPGKKDLELLALALDLGAAVLTHDAAAARACPRVGVLAVDLVDVIAFAYEEGWVDEPSLTALSQRLDAFAWRAPDWKGDVRKTVAARPRFERTAAALTRSLR